MKKSEIMISGLLTILIGILFIVLKKDVVSYAMTAIGVVLIVLAVMDVIDKMVYSAIAKGVIGLLIILFGWIFVSAALYILGAALIIYGAYDLYTHIRLRVVGLGIPKSILLYAMPILMIIVGFSLFFNQGGTVDWVFILSGAVAVLDGAVMIANAIVNK